MFTQIPVADSGWWASATSRAQRAPQPPGDRRPGLQGPGSSVQGAGAPAPHTRKVLPARGHRTVYTAPHTAHRDTHLTRWRTRPSTSVAVPAGPAHAATQDRAATPRAAAVVARDPASATGRASENRRGRPGRHFFLYQSGQRGRGHRLVPDGSTRRLAAVWRPRPLVTRDVSERRAPQATWPT